MENLPAGKLSLLGDGQFGSTGKGKAAEYIGKTNHIDLFVTDASANAGHSFFLNGKKVVAKFLPVGSISNRRSTIYLCPGAIIDPDLLLKELQMFDIDRDRVIIHPRCAIITADDKLRERDHNSSVTKIASTQTGVGQALSRKILRSADLAGNIPALQHFISPHFNLQEHLDWGCTALMEIPQGFDLSISSGLSYPHCTSREITVSSALSDAQIHPQYLGKVIVTLRTFPIRVGNIIDNGVEIGNSGPFYLDSKEITWKELGREEERTTVTNRVRRVATFSQLQYKNMLAAWKPDCILLNFCDYLSSTDLDTLLNQLPEVTHLGFGPEINGIKLNHRG